MAASLKGYLDGLPPETRRRIVLGMFAAFGTAMIPTLFAYNGWAFSTFVAGETRNPDNQFLLDASPYGT